MARGSPPKRNNMQPHKREDLASVSFQDVPRLRVKLHEALRTASPTFTDRLARTASVSRREAQRMLDTADATEDVTAESVDRAKALLDKFARSAS